MLHFFPSHYLLFFFRRQNSEIITLSVRCVFFYYTNKHPSFVCVQMTAAAKVHQKSNVNSNRYPTALPFLCSSFCSLLVFEECASNVVHLATGIDTQRKRERDRWRGAGRDIDHRKYHNRIYVEPPRQRDDNITCTRTPNTSNKNAVNGQIIA